MKRNVGLSICMTSGMFIYDLLAHGDQPIDWYKPVIMFCLILLGMTLFNKKRRISE